MLLLFLKVPGRKKYFIDVACAKVRVPQDAIHQLLKGSVGVTKAKAGVIEGIFSKESDDGCLQYFLRVNRDLLIALQ